MAEISIVAEPVAHLGSFTITNSILHAWLAALVLIGFTVILRKSMHKIPKGIQNVFEWVVEWLLGVCDSVTGDRKKSEKFFPLVATIFLFVLVSNYLGLLPGVGSIGIFEEIHGETVLVPLLRSSAADLNTTLAIAIIAVVTTHIFGIGMLGLWHHLAKFFPIAKLVTWKGRIPVPRPMGLIDLFVGILEGFSEIAKIVSFSFRLFGNIFAGEVLLLVITGLVAYLAPVPFYFLELFVGFIQAFVFAMLTLVFLQMATSEAAHEEEPEAHKELAEKEVAASQSI